MKTFIRSRKGSILAYTLIVLGIILAASISMMAASVTNQRSVSSSNQSVNAFQIADSGSQAVVKGLKEATGSDLNDVSGVTCTGGGGQAAVRQTNFLGGEYTVTFQDSDGETLKCNDSISEVASVKSVGTYRDTARAVEVAVAAGCTNPGEMVIVARNSGKSLPPAEVTKFNNFAKEIGNLVVGYQCVGCFGTGNCNQVRSSSSLQHFSGQTSSRGFSIYGDSGLTPLLLCSTAAGCSLHDGTIAITCDDGWALYGMCANDL